MSHSRNNQERAYPLLGWRRSLETYLPETEELDPALVRRAVRIATGLADYFRTELHDAERIPTRGGVLLVSNHGTWGIDTPALFARLYQRTGRVPRGLAEHLLVKLPVMGRVLRGLGAVDGTPDNAVRLLRGGQLAVVYPGGHRESFKASDQRYQLQWGRSRGYVRCAIRAGVPIVPVGGVGPDEALLTVLRERWLGRWLFGRDDYDLAIPLAVGLFPFPVRFTFRVGRPVPVEVPPSAADDEDVVERLHRRVLTATESLISAERERRFHPSAG